MVREAETRYQDICKECRAAVSHLPGCRPGHLVSQKNTFEPDVVKIQDEILGRSKQDSFGQRDLLVKSRFRRRPKEGSSTYTADSAHLSNTTATRRDIAKQLLDHLRKVAEKNLADIIAGDSNTAAYRERGKAKVSSTEDVWEETLLIRPQDVGQMEESGDCCGYMLTRSGEPSWRVARHGSFQLNKERMQINRSCAASLCPHPSMRGKDSREKRSQ